MGRWTLVVCAGLSACGGKPTGDSLSDEVIPMADAGPRGTPSGPPAAQAPEDAGLSNQDARISADAGGDAEAGPPPGWVPDPDPPGRPTPPPTTDSGLSGDGGAPASGDSGAPASDAGDLPDAAPPPPPPGCVPGEVSPCGDGVSVGTQTCASDGKSHGACVITSCAANYLLENGRCRACNFVAEYAHPARTCTNGVDTCTTPARANTSSPLAESAEGARTDGCSFGYWTGSTLTQTCSSPAVSGSFSADHTTGISASGNQLSISGLRATWGGNSTVASTLTLSGNVTVSTSGNPRCTEVTTVSVLSSNTLQIGCLVQGWGGSSYQTYELTFSRATISASPTSVGGTAIRAIRGEGNRIVIDGYTSGYGTVYNTITITLNSACWNETVADCRNNAVNGVCPSSLVQGSFDLMTARGGGYENGLLCFPANEIVSVCK